MASRLIPMLLCFALVSFALAGCAEVEEPEPPPGLALLIFPDVTASIDSAQFSMLKTSLDSVLRAVPYETLVEIIPVGETRNPASRSTFIYPSRTLEPIERRCAPRCEEQRNQTTSWIAERPIRLDRLRTDYQASRSIERSCLLNAVEAIEDRGRNLLQLQKVDAVHAVFLSDMIEECNRTPLGPVSFPDDDIEEVVARIDRWNEKRTWSTLRDSAVTISVIPQSPNAKIRRKFDDPDDFWRPFFAQFGKEGTKWDLNRDPVSVAAILSRYGDRALTPCEEVCR